MYKDPTQKLLVMWTNKCSFLKSHFALVSGHLETKEQHTHLVVHLKLTLKESLRPLCVIARFSNT